MDLLRMAAGLSGVNGKKPDMGSGTKAADDSIFHIHLMFYVLAQILAVYINCKANPPGYARNVVKKECFQ